MTIRDRARRYVARMPEAISGQHGHSTMFNVACVLVQGFDLNMSDARTLLEEYNTTLTEPFSTGEIKHKLESAAKTRSLRGRGYLLTPTDKPIRVRITPKKPLDTPPENIHTVNFRTPRTGASYEILKKTLSKEGNNNGGESELPVLPVLELVSDGKETVREAEKDVLTVLKPEVPVEDALPTLSSTGILRIPFNAPIEYRYWLRDTTLMPANVDIFSLSQIRESLFVDYIPNPTGSCDSTQKVRS